MRRLLTIACVFCLAAASAGAQPYAAPTKTATPPTEADDVALRAGIELHDEGKYDEAIARYDALLEKNPGNVMALYELAYSYAAKKDQQKSLEIARRGTEYRSELLPLFYDLIASAFDSAGEPQRAIEAYRKGLEFAPDAAVLYYNMAVTYQESLKDPLEARRALQKAAAVAPGHADTQLLLGQLYQSGGYRTQAFLALSTFLILQPAGASSLQGYGLWRAVLRGGLDAMASGTTPDGLMKAAPQPPAPTDEGDFTDIDRLFPTTHTAAVAAMNDGKTEIESLVGQVDALLARLERPGAAVRTGFAGSHYTPYFAELKKRNYVEPFVYWVSQRAPVPGVRAWIEANEPAVRAFLEWTSSYAWPKP